MKIKDLPNVEIAYKINYLDLSYMQLLGTINLPFILGFIIGYYLTIFYLSKSSKNKLMIKPDKEKSIIRDMGSDVNKCNDTFVLTTDHSVPEPNLEEISQGIGKGEFSKIVPQLWTSQGQNLIRAHSCDYYVH